MSMFLWGYFAAIATYLVIGTCIGVYIVSANLARFFGGGWGWKRMAKHVGLLTLFWPGLIAEVIA